MSTPKPLTGPQALKEQVVAGFASAAPAYDADGREFFQTVGQWLVDEVGIPLGAWVLDVGCGKGAVSLPAAKAAGVEGHVTGIDLAVPMLARARERALAAGLTNVTFRKGDAEDPATHPGWGTSSFDVILAAGVLQFLPRPREAVARWRELLTPPGKLGVAWTSRNDPRWAPVIAAIDAHVPDGVPGFAAYMARPPFDEVAAFEQTLRDAGYRDVSTGTRRITMIYNGPGQWWVTLQTQGPWALSWRHIPGEELVEAKWEAFRLLEQSRDACGSISRTLTFALTTARGRNG
jgi:ubiquinone/menaquinone biosynthesis C-methylase UbiE